MLPETTREAAKRFGDSPAYVAPRGFTLSYADLDRISDELAVGLSRRGLRMGDVLALVLPPGPEYLIAYLAAAKLGAITAGVNDKLSAAERRAVLERATPAFVLAAPGNHDHPAPGLEFAAADSADEVFASLRVAGERPPDLPEDPDRDVAIIFTSGTTGIPKGARYGNRQLTAITTNDVSDTWGGGGRSYTGVSFSTLGFMTKLPSNLRRGGLSLITNKWRASEALRLSAEFKLTVVGGVPTQVALMLRDPDFDSYDLSSVQYIVLGGGPVTPGLAEEARRRFHAKLSTRYACTESGIGLGTGFDDPEEDAIVSVGRPHPGVELQVVDANDDPLPVGEIGEVALRSDAIMSGYWNDPEQTAAAFTRDGFVRTGDLGYVDDRGRLRLVGRNKEMYVRGGYNVYPVEIEGLLSTHPAIAAVAIVPRPDSVMGEIGVAVIVVREGEAPPTLAEVRAHIEPDLARYKLPEAVRYAATLPLTPAEKLDRRALADIVRSDVEPDVR